MCPYVKIEISDSEIWDEKDQLKEQLREQLRQKRLQWLQSQEDKGKIYYDLYKQHIERVEIKDLKEKVEKVEEDIQRFLGEHLTDQQMKIFRECELIIKEYTSTNGKTKKLKERFKDLIHNLSILFSETTLRIHEYFSIKYKVHINVNNIETSSTSLNVFTREDFEGRVIIFSELNEAIEEKERFTNNTVRNLENDLYLVLTGQKTIVTNVTSKQVQQPGKYFKRWGVLQETERNERFQSYAQYHVTKFFIKENLHDEASVKSNLVEELSTLLIESYKSKRLIYRDFKWNTTKGYIELIKEVRYDDDAKKFGLTKKAGKRLKEDVPRKKVSVKSNLTKQNAKVVNEEILYFIVKKGPQVSKEDKKECLERIKEKLNVKKIGADDREAMEAKFDEILQVVLNNKSD
jgi:hypothetical protein